MKIIFQVDVDDQSLAKIAAAFRLTPATQENAPAPTLSPPAPPTPPTPPILTDRWASKKPEKWETIEVTMVKYEKKTSSNGEYLRITWPNQGRGYSYASVWDAVLFPFVQGRLNQKTTFFVTRKDKFLNIVGVRA